MWDVRAEEGRLCFWWNLQHRENWGAGLEQWEEWGCSHQGEIWGLETRDL